MYINYVFIGSFPTFASRSEPGRDWWHPANVKSDRRKHSAPSGQNKENLKFSNRNDGGLTFRRIK